MSLTRSTIFAVIAIGVLALLWVLPSLESTLGTAIAVAAAFAATRNDDDDQDDEEDSPT